MSPLPNLSSIINDLCTYMKNNIVAENIQIDADTNFKEIEIDSYSIVELLLYIERHFGIVIPESFLNKENLKSPKTLAECLIKAANENPERTNKDKII